MKREFLEGLGLEKDVIDKILAENGGDIEREKAKTTQAKADLADAQQKLADSTRELDDLKKTNGDVAAVQKKLDELQAKYDTDTQALQGQLAERDNRDALTKAINGYNEGKGIKFTSNGARSSFEGAWTAKNVPLKDGAVDGEAFKAFVAEYQKSDPDTFAPDKPAARFVAPVGVGGKPDSTPANVQMAKAMGAAKAEALKASNDVFSKYT